MAIYVPREDSFLLQIEVMDYARGKVLDVGTGSGIQALAAAACDGTIKVTAVDIDKEAIERCKRDFKNSKTRFIVSDLFSNVKGRFDTIIFNPPYLPDDRHKNDISVIGGRKGHETIERFLNQANSYLNENGIILLLFSSLTGREKIDGLIEDNAFVFEKLQEKGAGLMERLYVYLIRKSSLLKSLNRLGVESVRKFAKGRRGVVYAGQYKGRKVAVKAQRPDVAVKSLQNEISCLKKLQKHKIGPKLVYAGSDFFVYDFIEGIFIEDFVEKEKTRKNIIEVLRNVIVQCRKLDKLMMNKEEMHHPHRHVIITKNGRPVLVDFERCRTTNDPKNVSQFCQYLMTGRMRILLMEKGIAFDKKEMIGLAKEYKKDFGDKSFKKIAELVS